MKSIGRAHIAVLATSLFLGVMSPVAVAAGEFAPVVVLDIKGDAPEDLKRKIIESVSSAIRKTVLAVYSEEIYGTGRSFKSRRQKSGPMGIVGRLFGGVDRQLEAQVSSEMRPVLARIPQGETISYAIEIMWARKTHALGQQEKSAPSGQMFGLLWGLTSRAIGHADTANTLSLIADVVDMPVVQANEIPGGKQALYDQGRAAYEWLRAGQNAHFWPLYLGVFLDANNKALSLNVTINVKPSELNIALDPPEPEDYFESEYLEMRPAFYAPNLPLAGFIFQRSYQVGSAGTRPTVKVSFGHMVGNDVRALAMCHQICDKIGDTGPEYIYRYAPTIRGRLRVPETVTGKKASLSKDAVSKINEYLDFFVLINVVTFDLSGDSIELIPERSHIPLVVRLTDPLNGQTYFDVTKGGFGFDYMKRLVASEAAKEFTITMAKSLQDGDEVINKQFAGIVGRLNSLIE